MTKAQKIIKYLAIIFAFYLIFNIFGGIIWVLNGFAGALGLVNDSKPKSEHLREITTNIGTEGLATLKIDLQYSDLKIVSGDTFKAESDNPDIACRQDKNQLIIKENDSFFLNNKYEASTLTVYVPKGMVFDGVEIKAGVGSVSIKELNAKEIDFNSGTGNVKIDKLNVTDSAYIEGGVGKLSILEGKINDLDLDLGVGQISVTASLTGKTTIDAGIGQVNLTLMDALENYRFTVDKGIGDIRIDGHSVADDSEYGDGKNLVDINGGIGEIVIKSAA